MPAKTASYINALFLGVRFDLEEELVHQVSEMGVIHLFAISGLHVALLTGILSYALKRLGVIVEICQVILIGFLLGFMILTGGSASVVRASLMMIGFILNKQLKLGFSTLDIFSIVFLLNVMINPLQVTQLGFIYSYSLTLMLICQQSVIKEMNQIKASLFIPFLAQLASLPIQVFFYYELNLVSYLANLLVVPLFSFILIPLLLLVMIVPPLAPLSDYLFQLFENFITGIASTLTFNLTYGALSISVLFGLIAIFLTGCYRYERYKKRTTWLLTLMTLLLTLELNRYIQPFSILTMLDVGQGDSFVIQSPYQSCQMVVDTGGTVSFGKPGKSIFENTLAPYLLGEGVRQIDFLLLTHGHFDHVGEAIHLLEAFDVTHLVISKMSPNEVMQPVIAKALSQGTKILEVEKG
ncbi:MAG: ComEC/Rec2 family competence protein, partial [Turicibacter sp.]